MTREKTKTIRVGDVSVGGVSPVSVQSMLEDANFDDICISIKSSDVSDTVAAYRMMSEMTSYPLHLGVTESGTPYMEANLLKLDELGHDDPTMIKMLEDLTGVNARQIPLDDPDTMGIFSSPAPLGLPDGDPIIGKTGTIGIPEFGTDFTRGMACSIFSE